MMAPNAERQQRELFQRQILDLVKLVAEYGVEREEFMQLASDAWLEVTVVPKGKIIPFPSPQEE